MRHVTVLLHEAVDALALCPDSTVVDATLGAGGHAREILKSLNDKGTLVALDADPTAVKEARQSLLGTADMHVICRNFRELEDALDTLGIRRVDAILADLGWRTEQFAGSGKGFSFSAEEPLLMTYGDPKDYPFTAFDIVNGWSEESLANVLKGYGEEHAARRIARAICAARAEAPVKTSVDLARIVEEAVPAFRRHAKTHPATKTFQALRIAVNDELRALETFLEQALDMLAPGDMPPPPSSNNREGARHNSRIGSGGRLAVITFHSLEDRIVKQTFRHAEDEGRGVRITKRPIVPTTQEIAENPRARSAKLRIFERISEHLK